MPTKHQSKICNTNNEVNTTILENTNIKTDDKDVFDLVEEKNNHIISSIKNNTSTYTIVLLSIISILIGLNIYYKVLDYAKIQKFGPLTAQEFLQKFLENNNEWKNIESIHTCNEIITQYSEMISEKTLYILSSRLFNVDETTESELFKLRNEILYILLSRYVQQSQDSREH